MSKAEERSGVDVVVILASAVASMVAFAHVEVAMWDWFVRPLVGRSVGAWHMFGLAIFLATVRWKPGSEYFNDKSTAAIVGTLLLTPPIALGVGAIAHWGMQ